MHSGHLFGALLLAVVLLAALACAPEAPGEVAGEDLPAAAGPEESRPADPPPLVAEGELEAVREAAVPVVEDAPPTKEPALERPPASGQEAAREEPVAPQEKPSAADLEARAADEKANAAVVIDKKNAEVRIPCRFVNPTRQIEVFACHNLGPTHETVVEFDATGGRILQALQDIGCRSTAYWNGTMPGDFLRNQGDRLLVLVRWSHKGKKFELPAEAMLTDGDTGFPSFIRGFSFSAGPVEGARGMGVSRIAEITLGATQRERAVFSLLSHPTTLNGQKGAEGLAPCRALQPWSFAPLVNTDQVVDLPELVESRVAAEIIFRRVKSESELLRYTGSIASGRGLAARAELYKDLEPIALKIDSLKKSYEEILVGIAGLISLDITQLPEESRQELSARGGMLRALGGWYCSRIQHEYFRLYLAQEKYRLGWLRGQKPAEDKDGAYAGILKLAELRVESGLRYEVDIAEQEARLAASRLAGAAIAQESSLLELDRSQRLVGYQLNDMERRKAGLDPSEDAYLLKLLGEELRRVTTAFTVLAARVELSKGFLEEIRSRKDGTWPEASVCVQLRRDLAFETLYHSTLATRLISIDENIRWEEGDSDDGEDGVTEKEKAAAVKLAGLRKDRKSLEATADKAKADLDKLLARVKETCK
ncbi:MAG: hypothetical protein VX272_02785 [Planctomycetota bacterium]|nr:hypothetical protein [Planctomycetota bacterium]